MSLGSHGVDRVLSLQKILTRLCGTHFCTSLAHFALSFIREPNGPKLYEMHQNMSLGSHGVDWVLLLRKIPTRVRGTNFCTSSERFALNGRKNTQTVRNTPKHEVRDQWSGSHGFVAKHSDATSWHELLHVRPVLPRVS